ncbi:hypothetical protein T459_05947 [Capsicum annuum]|uniref:Uncharacterized protein n=1 Tax=Capsicum annuum TaxID=4072 RepID=A0A2G3A9E4_CAPAN|nr:hypothetical protein T459_05947 [Capsicum annuum]
MLTFVCQGQLYQRRMARAYNKKVRPRNFEVGQLVLRRILPHQVEAKGKFSPNWQSPFIVKKVLPNGALYLTDTEGKMVEMAINADAVKRYYPGNALRPYVLIRRGMPRGILYAKEVCDEGPRHRGMLDESLFDSFNLPMYFPSPEDMTKVAEKNDCFSIEIMELTYPKSKLVEEADAKTLMINLRAVLEGLIISHFESKIAEEACARTILKSEEIST